MMKLFVSLYFSFLSVLDYVFRIHGFFFLFFLKIFVCRLQCIEIEKLQM